MDYLEKPKCEESNKKGKPSLLYRCKKCRRAVASHENVLMHSPGEREPSFMHKKKNIDNAMRGSNKLECSSVFVEPLKWMAAVEEGAVQGKLICQCGARLGYFNWSGIQCSCGKWVTPAFQLHKSRMDESEIGTLL